MNAPEPPPFVDADPWEGLRRHTAARIALGHAGPATPTAAHLDFQMAHARARDAVHHAMDADAVAAAVADAGVPVLRARSAARDRATYLQRPDLGRRLDGPSRERLAALAGGRGDGGRELAFVIADGLSALAVERHAAPLLRALLARLTDGGWGETPAVVVEQGRVAIGDEVGGLLGAGLVVVLIGERPGLSSPDSLGVYVTHAPRAGRTDAERNCISNVRPEGLPVDVAAHKVAWLLTEARRRRVTGVALKEEAPPLPPVPQAPRIG